MFTQWGQFIIHDIVHTPVVKGSDGKELDCNCADPHPECINLPLGEDDIQFLSEGKTCHSLERSLPTPDKDCNVETRQQLNQISSYIDATTVYGTSAELAESIRDPESEAGELKADKPSSPEHGEFEQLPKFEIFEDNAPRINENLGLASMHTLFMREHNRIARELKALNPQWSSDTVFHETRLIIGNQTATKSHESLTFFFQTFMKKIIILF
ncbi:unnamed protein product [Oikopleura dioica]|uniref:Uncharacterized protein n=1 Tax=Oikopleura dioica TaxID=34765 RepID=E4WT33_OIKDI|nr:unnamed protein product [Oikopleura dioica]